MEAAALGPTALQITIKPTELEWIIDRSNPSYDIIATSIYQHVISQQTKHLLHSIQDVNDCKRDRRMASGRMLTITDVHYVPELRVNLLSPNRMMRHGWKADITKIGGSLSRKKGECQYRDKAISGRSVWARIKRLPLKPHELVRPFSVDVIGIQGTVWPLML
jgi:hypothetical protein